MEKRTDFQEVRILLVNHVSKDEISSNTRCLLSGYGTVEILSEELNKSLYHVSCRFAKFENWLSLKSELDKFMFNNYGRLRFKDASSALSSAGLPTAKRILNHELKTESGKVEAVESTKTLEEPIKTEDDPEVLGSAPSPVLLLSHLPKLKTAELAFHILKGFKGMKKVIKMGGGKKILAQFDDLACATECLAYFEKNAAHSHIKGIFSKYTDLCKDAILPKSATEYHERPTSLKAAPKDFRPPSRRLRISFWNTWSTLFQLESLIKSKSSTHRVKELTSSTSHSPSQNFLRVFEAEFDSIELAIEVFLVLHHQKAFETSFS